MPEATKLDEQFYIVSTPQRSRTPPRVLKYGDSFAVFDHYGDIVADEAGDHGLYYAGTRYLSRLELSLGRERPLLLSSTVSADNTQFTADLTNPDILRDGHVAVERGVIHVFRSRVLSNGGCAERLRVSNHALQPVDVPITIRFEADYADLFEVRGTRRVRRGRRLDDEIGDQYLLRYLGLDGVERRTRLQWSLVPDRQEPDSVLFVVSLDRHATVDIDLSIGCELDDVSRSIYRYDDALTASKRLVKARDAADTIVVCSNEAVNRWIRRSWADLRMLITETPHGPYPYAGIPWFSTPFGRDGIITALELLWAAPNIARGVLTFLAETQATAFSEVQDAEPGKILHEMRDGEMAALGEVPFGRYYGSADATPLFVMLAAAYFERTGDIAFIERLWPHIRAALDWLATGGDQDRDGFVEYQRRTDIGLIHQGWKDSHDSIFHADGTLAEPPIACCEIQGYAYAAWMGAARLARARRDTSLAERWEERGERLREHFEDAFWCEDLGTYALALDGHKRPCRVVASNAGHCLYAGIVAPDRARQVAKTLFSDASFSGWGIRTVAAGQARYNPMSYHNGSVWPHDNAVIAAGFARYGLTTAAMRLMETMLDLSAAVDLHRLPELICGFHRRTDECPTLYPVACAPQAWSAGAVYLLLASCLGIAIEAPSRRITLSRAVLPETIESIRIRNVSAGDATVDLLLARHTDDVALSVTRRAGAIEVVAVK